MPFAKIKTGKSRGKYRSPSGRVFTARQVRAYYATGGFKNDRLIGDAESYLSPSTDPTRTAGLRDQFRNEAMKKVRQFKTLMRAYVVTNNLMGIGTPARMNPGGLDTESVYTGFVEFITNLGYKVVVAEGVWMHPLLRRAYESGVDAARSIMRRTDIGLDLTGDLLYRTSAKHELEGIVDATLQQLSRKAVEVITLGLRPMEMQRQFDQVVDKIMAVRVQALANVAVVQLHNAGRLDTFQSGGVDEVGVVPEVAPVQEVGDSCGCGPGLRYQTVDARKPANQSERAQAQARTGGGQFVAQTFTRETYRTAKRANKNFKKIEKVSVQTAGDGKVCRRCRRLARNGPYKIDRARSLFPAHPNCRCAFVPAGTSVDEEDDDDDE